MKKRKELKPLTKKEQVTAGLVKIAGLNENRKKAETQVIRLEANLAQWRKDIEAYDKEIADETARLQSLTG